jgi:hypothetical protein|tara:strand:+ start:3883 stop:4602 length:720 start_codon:yes stop_codon:yes gene_type:complete
MAEFVKKKKVAIVGTAPSSWQLAPFGDPEWEIWGISAMHQHLPRWDRWFEFHDLDIFVDLDNGPMRPFKAAYEGHLEWLGACKGPLYVKELDPRVPHGKLFPWQELVTKFGRGGFTNSISWLVAFAIKEGYEEIGIWGVDMAQESEYRHQKPGCYFFMGWAQGAGIKMTIPEQSDLFKIRALYGFEDNYSEFHAKCDVRKRELTERIRAADLQKEKFEKEGVYLRGAINDIDYFINNWN